MTQHIDEPGPTTPSVRRAYCIRLQWPTGADTEQASRGLRAILKTALRAHGMKCISCELEPEATPQAGPIVNQCNIPKGNEGRAPE